RSRAAAQRDGRSGSCAAIGARASPHVKRRQTWLERMSVGGQIGADLVEIAQRDSAEACEITGAAAVGIIRLGVGRRAGPAKAEIGLVRHQKSDEPDPENRAKEHAGHPVFLVICAQACTLDFKQWLKLER